jgi:hypothetical protein
MFRNSFSKRTSDMIMIAAPKAHVSAYRTKK